MTIIFFVIPFHFFYFSFRIAVLKTMLNNFFPIGKQGVKFRDFVFGDVLTSLTRPFNSLTLCICLIGCGTCFENNERGDCKRSNIGGLIANMFPFVIRFFQCLNRYYYTKMAWPHLANALKYTCGMINAFISWQYSTNRDLIIIVGLINTSYLLFWDIRMDWNVGYINAKKFFLRDKLLYPVYFYYFAIITNFVLRLTWLINLFIITTTNGDEIKILIFSFLEVYRRTQWTLFRVENENQNNFEKYRTVLEIPPLPID